MIFDWFCRARRFRELVAWHQYQLEFPGLQAGDKKSQFQPEDWMAPLLPPPVSEQEGPDIYVMAQWIG